MTSPAAADIEVSETRVPHPEGAIYVRTWSPAHAAGNTQTDHPIVLLHDSLGCVALWRNFPAQLCAATSRTVIAYDRLGFGQSDQRADRPSLNFIAEEARRYFAVLRERLGLDGFVLFGHSVGGGMAVNCAAEFAAECEALITVAAQAFPEDCTLQGVERAKQQFADEQQFQRLVRYHGHKARWVLEAWTETWLHPDFANWSLAATLPRVRCPVLALHGANDEYGSSLHPQTIAALSAGPAQVEILADSGHLPHRENPTEVLERITRFLAAG